MSEELVIQTNGPYLRVVLPDFDPDWDDVWEAIEFELEEGIERAEVVAHCYPDNDHLARVRELVEELERRGVDPVVEWDGTPSRVNARAELLSK